MENIIEGSTVLINNTSIDEGIKDGVGEYGEVTGPIEKDGCYPIMLESGQLVYFTREHFDLVA
jgi:hypothetical protein